MTTTFEVAGRTVAMPVVVRDALAAHALFVVSAGPVRRWLPDGLEVVGPAPGRALLYLSAIHYRDNDLGRYDEIAMAFVVRHGLRQGIYIHRMPVDDEFSRAAGSGIWGYPKTVDDVRVERHGGEIHGRWSADGREVLRLRVAGRGTLRMPARAQRGYTVVDGVLHETRFVIRATGVGVRPGGARVELGDGQAAGELRVLGLPRAPVVSASMGRLQSRFDAPRPV